MNETPPATGPASPTSIVTTALGGVGLVFSLMGCLFMPFGMLGAALCIVAIVLGIVEMGKVRRGESPEASRTLAILGEGLGGGGCLVSGCWSLLMLAFVGLYLFLIVGATGASALGVH